MTHRLASAFAVVLLVASPALAQMQPGRELELGGGWFQDNPLDVDDIRVVASGPSVDLAWTTWRNERTGIAIGVTSILGREASRWREQEVGICGHVTWRWRWVNADGRGFFHVGVGAGPLLRRESSPVVKWDERQTTYRTGETEHHLFACCLAARQQIDDLRSPDRLIGSGPKVPAPGERQRAGSRAT